MAKKRSRKADGEARVPNETEDSSQRQDKPPAAKAVPKTAPKPTPKPAVKIKPKTDAERKRVQIEGIKKTVYASVLGILLGFFSYYTLGVGNQRPMLWSSAIFFVIASTYFIQKFTYRFMDIDPAEFKGKDWFYVEFLAVDLWLVTWTLLLN